MGLWLCIGKAKFVREERISRVLSYTTIKQMASVELSVANWSPAYRTDSLFEDAEIVTYPAGPQARRLGET